jgi:hypothetical protein
MNVIKYILLLSIFLTVYTYADVDISSQIAQLKNAKKSEKYMIMNKIKMQIAQLNSTQRAKAIKQLRTSMPTAGNTQSLKITGSSVAPQLPTVPASIPTTVVPVMPTVPTMPGMGNVPVPVVPTVPTIPVIPMSMQSMPKGGQ